FMFVSRTRRQTISLRDWSADVCSSDLREGDQGIPCGQRLPRAEGRSSHRRGHARQGHRVEGGNREARLGAAHGPCCAVTSRLRRPRLGAISCPSFAVAVVPAPAALAGPTVALDLTTGKRNWYFQGAPA